MGYGEFDAYMMNVVHKEEKQEILDFTNKIREKRHFSDKTPFLKDNTLKANLLELQKFLIKSQITQIKADKNGYFWVFLYFCNR